MIEFNLSELIFVVILSSLYIWGIFAVFDEDNLLWGVRKIGEKTLGTFITKPMFSCPACMASLHGAYIGIFYYGLTWIVLPYIICLCGLNFIIKTIIYG